MPVGFFLEGAAGPSASQNIDGVNSALSFLKTAGAVRLLRAYNRMDTSEVRQALVELAEQIAGREDVRTSSKKRKSA